MMAGLDGLSGDWKMLKFVVLVWGERLEITLQLKRKTWGAWTSLYEDLEILLKCFSGEMWTDTERWFEEIKCIRSFHKGIRLFRPKICCLLGILRKRLNFSNLFIHCYLQINESQYSSVFNLLNMRPWFIWFLLWNSGSPWIRKADESSSA